MADNNQTNVFTDELQKRLLAQSDIISSAQTGLESKIGEAITGVKTAREAGAARIESAFGRERGVLETRATEAERTLGRAQRGIGIQTQFSALTKLRETTDKDLKDLEQRKQELILQGEATAAGEIAKLQLKSLEFQQTSQQQVFTNLLAGGQFGLQQRQEARLQAAQSQQEKASIADIALEFGLEITEGETLDSITAKARPFASADRLRAIERDAAEVRRINAEATKALDGDSDTTDPAVIAIIAEAANNNPAVLGTLRDPEQTALVVNEMTRLNQPRDFDSEELQDSAQSLFNAGLSFQEAIGTIAADARITNKDEAEEIVRDLYGRPAKEGASLFARAKRAIDVAFAGSEAKADAERRFRVLDKKFTRGETLTNEERKEFRDLGRQLGRKGF